MGVKSLLSWYKLKIPSKDGCTCTCVQIPCILINFSSIHSIFTTLHAPIELHSLRGFCAKIAQFLHTHP